MSGDAEHQAIGPILDELRVTAPLAPNERITEAIVIARCVDLDSGGVALGIFHSDIDWITKIGMVEAARVIVRDTTPIALEDEDGG